MNTDLCIRVIRVNPWLKGSLDLEYEVEPQISQMVTDGLHGYLISMPATPTNVTGTIGMRKFL